MNKIKKIKIVIGLILLTWLGCKEEPQIPQDLGFLSLGEAKEYMLFKQGTWWIYKNSLTQELDTIVLTSCSLDTFSASSSKRKFTYEDIAYTIKSQRDGATYLYYSYGKSAEVTNFQVKWVWERSIIHNLGSNVGGFIYPFEIGSRGGV